jgi:5-methylthioribose kinase
MLDLLAENLDDIDAHLHTLHWIAPDETIHALEPAGAGNMNRTLRAHLPHRTLVLKQSVPFVAKYPSIPAPADRIGVEAAFYRATAGSVALASRLPEVRGYDPDNRLMALEDLGASSDFTDIYAHRGNAATRSDITAGHIASLLHWIGALHALHVDRAGFPELENRAMRVLNHAHIFDIPLQPDNGIDLDAFTPGLSAIAKSLASDSALKEKAATLGKLYLGEAEPESAPALLHGDFYPGSWLRHPTMGVKIIDPEFAFIGAPEFDIGVLMAHLQFAGFAQADLMNALDSYDAPPRFSLMVARAFAGIEVIRRLLGVAQLPLTADLETKCAWIETARQFVVAT